MGTRKLGRPTAHRMSMLNGMVAYLIENGKIETTYTRAKEVSVLTDKVITLGKKGGLANYRKALACLNNNKAIVSKLFDTVAPKYASVNGGYTAVYKLGPRRGDGAEMALITLTAAEVAITPAKEAAPAEATPAKEEVKAEETAEVTEEAKETDAE